MKCVLDQRAPGHILEELVDVLTTRPVMAYPNLDEVFQLNVDASQMGLGDVLYQEQSYGSIAVVSYCSRTLTPAEMNYHLHSGKLDFVALKWVVTERYRDYLYYAKGSQCIATITHWLTLQQQPS